MSLGADAILVEDTLTSAVMPRSYYPAPSLAADVEPTESADVLTVPSPRYAPHKSLVVILPENHSFAPADLYALLHAEPDPARVDVILACAGQSSSIPALRRCVRDVQILLAPAGTGSEDLRELAISQADGDIVTLINGTDLHATVRAQTLYEPPALSVVVAARNAGATLPATLAAIRQSDLAPEAYELIVVDDASVDGSAAIAARYADTVVKLTGRSAGPAYARNRGADLTRGDVVAFVAEDALVRPDTLSGMLAVLSAQPEIDAVSASNDEKFVASDFVSDYWKLLVSYGDRQQTGRCGQFASSCGVVRREAFMRAGKYDEWRFAMGCVESVELGDRLLAAGHQVMLSADHKVSRIKRWDIADIAREIWRRGGAMARSLGYMRMRSVAPGEVVFTLSRTLTPALALLTTVMLAAAFVPAPHVSLKWAVALTAILVTNLPVYRYYAGERGVVFAFVAAPLHIFAQGVAVISLCVGWVLRDLVGDVSPDATTQAYSEVGLNTWPPVPRKR